MTILPTTMMATPYYLEQTTVIYSNDIVALATGTLSAGYYIPYIQSVQNTEGFLEDPHELFRKIRTVVSSAYFDVSLTSQAKTKITYLGTGSGMLQFSENSSWATHFSPVLHALGFKPSSVVSNSFSFVSQGVSYVSDFSPFGAIFTNAKTDSTGWQKSNMFAGYTITPTGHVYGNKNSNDLYKQKFNLRFFPKNKETQNADTNFVAITPMYFKKWETLFWKTPVGIGINQYDVVYDSFFLPEPYTVQQFLNQCPGQPIYCLFGNYQTCISASVNPGTDETYVLDVVYQTPESIKKQNQINPSIPNLDKLYDIEDFEVVFLQSNQMILNSSSFQSVSSFDPTQISNLFMWLRSDDLVQASGTVSQVNDKSGNGKHAVQATSGSQPYYFAAGGLNNLPYWQGTSANSAGRYLLAGANGDFDFLHNGTDWTIIYVASTPASTGKLILGTQAASSNDLGFAVWEYTSPGVAYYMGNGSSVIISKIQTTGFTVNQYQKTIIRYDDDTTPNMSGSSETNSTIFTANKAGSNSATTSGRKFGVGCAGSGQFSTDAKFHEVIVYNKKLSDSEVVSIQEYLTTRYGFNPANVPGLQAWWTAEDVALSGGKITQFNDKSGYARNATNANTTYQVTQSVDAAYNNKTVAVMNGNALQAYAPTSFTTAQPLTIFAVGDVNGTAGVDYETFIDSANAGTRIIMRSDPSFNMIVYAGWANITLRTYDVKANPSIGWCEYNGASSKGNVNSNTATTLASSPGAGSLTQPQLFVGNAGSYMMKNGAKFAALLIYNRVLTTDEKTLIIEYLSDYYGIALT